MLIVSLAVFALISFSEGDSVQYVLGEDASEESIAAYRSAIGLDKPFAERYLLFLRAFFTFDFGRSASGEEISSMIASRLYPTLSITIFALILALLIAIPASYISLRSGTIRSALATGYATFASSLPLFLLALLLVLFFSLCLGILPVAGYVPPSAGLSCHIRSIFLPSLSLAILHSSLLLMMFRSSLRENMKKEFSAVAATYGMGYWKRAMLLATKPSLPVLVALVGESAAAFVGGSAVVESIFSVPGLGSLLVSAALSRDAMLGGILVLLVSLFVSIVSALSEIAAYLLDPRRRRGL